MVPEIQGGSPQGVFYL